MMFQVLPELSPYDFGALKRDIKERGVMVPVEYDQDGNIIDGHHRVLACRELGIEEWPRIVRDYADDLAKRTQARRLNIARRHLDAAAKRTLIEAELKDRPEESNRAIAADLGVNHETVSDARDRLVSTGGIRQLDKTKGRDGKKRKKPSKPKVAAVTVPGVEATGSASDILAAAKEIRTDRADAKRAVRTGLLNELSLRNAPLPERKYPIIYADPPWQYDFSPSNDRSVENHYPTMSIEDIMALDVAAIATPDAMLFLWAPPSFIKKGLAVLEAWGFELATSMVWVKDKIGTGIYVRQRHEFLLLGKRGQPITPRPGDQPDSVIESPRGGHSVKPDIVYGIIDMYPGLPKIELFSRAPRHGFDAWGNESAAA